MRAAWLPALALLLGAILQPALALGGALEAPAAEPARAAGCVKIRFRADGPYWTNGTYSIWPANTSSLPSTSITVTFNCTAHNEYGGEDVYTGGVGWVSDPLLGPVFVGGDVAIRVWLNGTQGWGQTVGVVAYVADVDENDEVVEYWSSDVMILFSGLPAEPTLYTFTVRIDGHLFRTGHKMGFGVVVGSTEPGYLASASFGGGPHRAMAYVPTPDYVRVSSVALYGPDGAERAKFYVGEDPLTFNISVSDPFSNFDVAEVRVVVHNSTHTVLDEPAEAYTDRHAYKAWYRLVWHPQGVGPGNYTVEVRARDNSGNEDVRTFEVKFVLLKVANFTCTPSWLKKGLGDQPLCVSFENGGNDMMYNVSLVVANACDILLKPDWVEVGDLEAGGRFAFNFTARVPEDAGVGPRNITFLLVYTDFRGVWHEENLTVQVYVALVGTSLTLEVEPKEARTLDQITARVELADEFGQPLANITVKLALDGSPLAELTTDQDGRAECSFKAELGAGEHMLEAVFEGTDIYAPSSATATFRLRLREASIHVDYPSEVEAGRQFQVNSTLTGEDGEPLVGAELELYVFENGTWIPLGENTTGPDGTATFILVLGAGEHRLKLVFAGDEFYAACEAEFSITARASGGQGGGTQEGPGVLVPLAVAGAVSAAVAGAAVLWLRRVRGGQ